ncbi:hypothetical protein IHE45_02G057000 [Dioscorea alata]|uniref:Uncharacterized protein n=1 Tax=Dioscorea alata TaxID=55571 RepID=A0ACB7WQ11_DIOAL|nr:hypothetical protein IHE45_02G057000 [Dioscorea alata]
MQRSPINTDHALCNYTSLPASTCLTTSIVVTMAKNTVLLVLGLIFLLAIGLSSAERTLNEGYTPGGGKGGHGGGGYGKGGGHGGGGYGKGGGGGGGGGHGGGGGKGGGGGHGHP